MHGSLNAKFILLISRAQICAIILYMYDVTHVFTLVWKSRL